MKETVCLFVHEHDVDRVAVENDLLQAIERQLDRSEDATARWFDEIEVKLDAVIDLLERIVDGRTPRARRKARSSKARTRRSRR